MLGRFVRLRLRDKVALIQVIAILLIVRVGLRILPADRLACLLGVPLAISEAAPAPPASLQAISPNRRREIRMLDSVVRRRPSRSRCLENSLAIGLILHGAGPRLRIGVAREETTVAAHAWVEAGGRSFLADASFLPLGEPPGDGN